MTASPDLIRARQGRVLDELARADRPEVLTRSEAAIAFLTDVDVRGFSGGPPVAVLRRDGAVTLVASEADRPLLAASGFEGDVRFWEVGRSAPHSRRQQIAGLVPYRGTAGDAGDEELLDRAMRDRSAEEILHLRNAADLADIGYTAVVDRMTPDLRSLEIVRNVDRSLRTAGGSGWWSPRERLETAGSLTHYPLESIAVLLGRGEEPGVLDPHATLPFALYPLSSRYAGAAGTTIVLEPPAPAVRSRAEALAGALEAALDALAPGVTGGEVHAAFLHALAGVVPSQDLDPVLGYSLGTGIGSLLIDSASHEELHPGEVVSLRAALPEVGGAGIAFQTSALITDAGSETLNQVPMRLIELY